MSQEVIKEVNSQMTEQSTTGNRYLSFSLGSEEFAIPLLDVKEVIAMPEFTPIPCSPPHFLGIMNLRGQVISVLDLRTKLSIKPLNSPETAVIICDLDPLTIGVVVDSINSVITPESDEVSDKPEIQSKASDFITGVFRKDKNLVLFLDIARALSVQDKLTAQNAVQMKKAG